MTEGPIDKPMQELGSELTTAKDFVLRNIIPAKEGRKCVDGRYEIATEDSGMIARPGGDFGYVMVLLTLNRKLSLGMTPEQCIDAVYRVVTGQNGRFYMHTDNHANPDYPTNHHVPIIGCGHAEKPTHPELAATYGLNPEDVGIAIEYAKEKAKHDNKIRLVILRDDHKEQGVLRILGVKITVNSQKDNSMYFVYDKTRDNNFIEQVLVPGLAIPNVSVEDFKRISDQQLMATLQNLAAGLPVFDVDADGPVPEISLAA